MQENEITIRPSYIKSVQMLLEDESKIGSSYQGWAIEAYIHKMLDLGCDSRKRSIEATENRRKAEAAQRAAQAGLDRFAQELLHNAAKYQTLESLLELGSACHVPSNVVLDYFNSRNKVQAKTA